MPCIRAYRAWAGESSSRRPSSTLRRSTMQTITTNNYRRIRIFTIQKKPAEKGMVAVIVRDALFDERAFPLDELCKRKCLPTSGEAGVDTDWHDVKFASIVTATALAAIQVCGRKAGSLSTITIPANPDVKRYLSRMDYFSIIGIPVKENFTRHETKHQFVPLKLIPIDEIEADVNGAAGAVSGLLSSTMNLSLSAQKCIDFCVGEIVDNIVQHSKSSSPGVVGAQCYPQRGFADICFADCGVGIAATMAQNPAYRDLSKSELVLKAFEHRSGQWFGNSEFGTSKVSGGEGLAKLSGLVRSLGGAVWTVSHDEAICINGDGIRCMGGHWFPGTVIVMRVPNVRNEVLESEVDLNGFARPFGNEYLLW